MNKFIVFTIVAFATVAAVKAVEDEEDSQYSIRTTDDEEKSLLTSDLRAFGSFCIESRDYVISDIKETSNNLSSNIFSLFFDSVDALGKDAVEVAKLGTERLSKQLANPDAEISEPANDVERIIADGQARMRGQNQPQAFLQAFKSQVGAISAAVGGMVNERINKIRSFVSDTSKISEGLQMACERVKVYESELADKFEEYKSELAAKDEKYASVRYESVPCVTVRRVASIEGLCTLVDRVKAPMAKLWASRAGTVGK